MQDACVPRRRCLALGVGLGVVLLMGLALDHASAIDVDLTLEEAKQALADGRDPMAKAEDAKKVQEIVKQASLKTRVGADPEKNPCGPSAVLRTKRFWLEAFGRKEAMESKKQGKAIRMPEEKIRELLDMPYLEVEVQLCGDEEYFAEGAKVSFQQGSKNIYPVDIGKAERGRKNPMPEGPEYRSRFVARFAYDDFDPNAKTKILVYFPDGKMINIPADFSTVK